MIVVGQAPGAADAVARALALVGHRVYRLGPSVGEFRDCVGLAWEDAWRKPRHIPGLNRGLLGALLAAGVAPAQAALYLQVLDVEDDVNTNALIADGLSACRLVQVIPDEEALAGDLVMYPTIHDERASLPFVGHVGLISSVARFRPGNLATLDTVQCCGPNGRSPGVLALDGSAFQRHTDLWPRLEHRSRIVRVIG